MFNWRLELEGKPHKKEKCLVQEDLSYTYFDGEL